MVLLLKTLVFLLQHAFVEAIKVLSICVSLILQKLRIPTATEHDWYLVTVPVLILKYMETVFGSLSCSIGDSAFL